MANEYIRHLTENGVWQYSNVKSVGELYRLKTKTKVDVVSAINELNSHYLLNSDNISSVLETVKDIDSIIGSLDASLKEEKDKLINLAQELASSSSELTSNMNNIKSELEGRLEIADGKISDIYTKAEELQNKFNENAVIIDGKLTSIEQEIITTKDEVSSKLSKTEFDNAVGVNKWVASFFDMTGDKYATNYPKLEDVSGMSASYVEEIKDSVKLYPFTSPKNGLLHLFTNVRLSSEKTIVLSIEHANGMAVLINGGYIYYRAGNATGNVSISLRSGWNTIEILVGVHNSVGKLNANSKISDMVDKMTSVIGVGGKDETRLVNNETMIIQTNEKISLKADSTVVEQLGNQVSHNSAQLEIQAEQIASKVSSEEMNAYTGRLEQAESSITQQAGQIELKASKEEVDTLNGRVTTNESSISQLSESITLKAEKKDLDEVTGKVNNAVGEIAVLHGEIALKASKTELDSLTGSVNDNTASIITNAEQIALKASKTEVDALGNRVTQAETSITANAEAILLKASKSELDEVTGKVGNLESSFEITKNEINSSVSSIAGRLDMAETNINQTSEAIKLKADKNQVDDINGRLTLAEASLTLANDEIKTKVTSSEVQTAIDENLKPVQTKISAMETSIEQTAGELALKATKTEVETAINGTVERVSQVESELKLQSDKIETKVSNGDMQTYVTQTLDTWGANVVKQGEVVSALNLDTSGVKIKGELIDITGMVTFESLNKEVQDKIIIGEQAGGIAQDAIDIANDVDAVLDSWKVTGKTTINGGMIETDSITTRQLKVGAVTSDILSSTAIDGKTITGATIRTSSTATTTGGVILDSSGIYGYNSSGQKKFSVGTSGILTATDAIINGTFNAGASSTFAGTIETEKDIIIGNNIYLKKGTSWANSHKKLYFDYVDGSDSGRTYIQGSRLGLQVNSDIITLHTNSGGYIDLEGAVRTSMDSSFNFNRTSGYAFTVNYRPALFTNGFVVSGGTVDLSGATVTGVTAVFG